MRIKPVIARSRLNGLKKARRQGIGRLLLLARRDFLSRLLRKLGRSGGKPSSAGALLPFIDLEGTRSTELARRVGISKQAIGNAIRELEEAGLLKRVADGADGRAFLVSFTKSGVDYLLEMHKAITQIEREYDNLVGAARMNEVRAALRSIAYADEGDED